MKKTTRQGIIKRLIQENDILTQEELIRLLQAEGVTATQATVSRDVRELGIVKGHSQEGRIKYVLVDPPITSTNDRLEEAIIDSVEQVSCVQFMVVIQTYLGSANIVAAIIDDMKLPEVAGTLAGANTLAIITHSNEEAQGLHDLISSYLTSK